MALNDTIIVVGTTEKDQYGNLNITCKDGSTVRVNKKHESLHDLFQQGRAILLHWETYMDKPYVADAKPVEGELPPPQTVPETGKGVPDQYPNEPVPQAPPNPQAVGMMTKEVGDMIRASFNAAGELGSILKAIYGKDASVEIIKWYRSQGLGISRIPFDGANLPKFDIKKEE